jgi:hypothetical protein
MMRKLLPYFGLALLCFILGIFADEAAKAAKAAAVLVVFGLVLAGGEHVIAQRKHRGARLRNKE